MSVDFAVGLGVEVTFAVEVGQVGLRVAVAVGLKVTVTVGVGVVVWDGVRLAVTEGVNSTRPGVADGTGVG